MSALGPYARVYHSIADDPKFDRVYADDRALGTWLRMLLVADAMYPTSAPMPKRTKAVELLLEAGLIVEKGGRYIVKGLEAEREKRAQSARNAAAVRWQSGSNAGAMREQSGSNASKAEQSKDEQSNGADASKSTSSFMGFRQKPAASAAEVKRQDDDAWKPCAECGVVGRKHSADGKHTFRAVAS